MSLAAVIFICHSNYLKSNHFPRDDHSFNKTGFDHQRYYHLHCRTNSHRGDHLKHHHVLLREREREKDKEWYEWGDSSTRISPLKQNSSKFLPAARVCENNDPTPLFFILEHLWISAKIARHNWYFTGQHELWGMHPASLTCTVVKHSDRTTYAIQYDKPHEEITPKVPRHTYIYIYIAIQTYAVHVLYIVHSPHALSETNIGWQC